MCSLFRAFVVIEFKVSYGRCSKISNTSCLQKGLDKQHFQNKKNSISKIKIFCFWKIIVFCVLCMPVLHTDLQVITSDYYLLVFHFALLHLLFIFLCFT